MSERTSFEPGTPSWVDLGTPDVGAAAAFYAELFGWAHEEAGDPGETMGYGFFLKEGKQVAGVGPLQDPQQPPAWSSYISVEDADATAAKVRDAGGRVLMEPTDLPNDSGRMAVFADSVAAVLCAFQPDRHHGAQLVGEPGTWIWNEHASRQPEKAQEFYSAVFGWRFRPVEGGRAEYWTFSRGDGEEGLGGMIRITEDWPAGVPSHWAVYFAVEDTDEAAGKVKELDGIIHVEPFDTPAGRIAIATDPLGAAFSLIAPVPPAAG